METSCREASESTSDALAAWQKTRTPLRRMVASQLGLKWSRSRCVRQTAATSATATPVPASRCAAVRGPIPASIKSTPPGDRTTVQFPPDPLASTQTSTDILVS